MISIALHYFYDTFFAADSEGVCPHSQRGCKETQTLLSDNLCRPSKAESEKKRHFLFFFCSGPV